MTTIHRQVRLEKGRRKHKQRQDLPDAQVGRVPRVSRLMALAIRLDQSIRDGVFDGQAAIATLGHVSRARMTQIMNLLYLAPDIQEQLLFLSARKRGRDAVTERHLRRIAAEPDWQIQRELWRRNLELL